jgi:hypothetical protein
MIMIGQRRLWTVVAIVALGCGGEAIEEEAGAPAAAAEDPDIAPAGEPTALPAGYALRLDSDGATPSDFRVTPEDGGVHVRTGPAGILFNAADAVPAGDYSVSATFTELEAPPNHREAFGLIIGGSDLEGPQQQYTYFLVRADGRYLIKKRMAGETSDVSDGWVESEAVQAATEGGEVSNALEVRVAGDQVHFSINGQEVATMSAAEVDTHGIAGVRINHNLNVRVSGFAVNRM